MNKKLEKMNLDELRIEIDGLAIGCHELDFNVIPGSSEIENNHLIPLLTSMKRKLVSRVYFAKQKGLKKSLEPIDYEGAVSIEELAREYLEDLIFLDSSLKRYNKYMKKGELVKAFGIVDRLKSMGVLYSASS